MKSILNNNTQLENSYKVLSKYNQSLYKSKRMNVRIDG